MAEMGSQTALLELEEDRKGVAKARINSYYILGSGLACLVAGVTGILGSTLQLPLVGAGVIVLLVGFYFYNLAGTRRAEYAYSFKQKVVRALLLDIDPSLRIEPRKGMTDAEFRFSQLFSHDPDRMSSEDQISGRAGKTAFCFSEVHAEYKTTVQTKHGRQEQWHDIFEGIIFIADFNKPFKGTTLVRPRDAGNAIGAWIAKNAPIFSPKSEQLVQLENPDFCKAFVTWSNDQVEARYILTPAMMERLCCLNSRSQGTLSVSFTGNCLYLAFPLDTNYFEPPLFKTLLDPGLMKDDMEIIRFMYEIVQDLDLNTRIWGKE